MGKVFLRNLLKYLRSGGIPVITGFQGINNLNRITTIGRSGSDASAIMIAKFFKADECIIYTDVEGVYTTDPRINKKAKKIKKIEYDEMLEMSSLGSKVMQPTSVQDAKINDIEIRVKSSFTNKSGTLITKKFKKKNINNEIITGISFTKNDAKITIAGVKDKPGVAAYIFEPLSKNFINVDMVVQNISLDGKETDLTFTIRSEDVKKTEKIIRENKNISFRKLSFDMNLAKISIIGVGMITTPGITYRMFKALASKKINIMVISTSEIKISVLISSSLLKKAVAVLHNEFNLDWYMNIRPFREIKRRKTRVISVGNVKIGGDNPISVQSMTNTLTTDIRATINQINDIAKEGADIVRVSCPDKDSTLALKEIVKHVPLPIVADIHFHYKRAIEAAENGAKCLRINPGNIGDKKKIYEVLSAAKNNNCSVRIGVNAGSLERDILEKFKEPCPEALVESALRNIKILEDQDFFNFKVSVKSSDVFLSIAAYRQLSKVTDYPLHVGITEAGSFVSGSIKSSIGLGSLLMDGIGDTIRISLSDDPPQEIKIGNEILKSLNLRNRGVKIISCPSCARQAFKVIDTVKILEEKLSHIKTPVTLSIIGCVVNGPGEAAMTDIGITGGGKGNNMLYLSGIQSKKVLTDDIIEKVVYEVEKKASELENK